MPGIAVADRQQVAVEMHGALRLSGGARGEADQADVVAGGVHGPEIVRLARHPRLQPIGAVAGEIDDAPQSPGTVAGLLNPVGEPRAAPRHDTIRLRGDRRLPSRAPQRAGEIGKRPCRIAGSTYVTSR